MFDRFSDRAKKTMSLARLAALRRQHPYIDEEHLLLGLFQVGKDPIEYTPPSDLSFLSTTLFLDP